MKSSLAENTFYSVISQVLPGQRCLQLEHPPQDKSKRVKQIKDARQPCPCFGSVILLDLCDGLQKATRHCKYHFGEVRLNAFGQCHVTKSSSREPARFA